MELVAGNSNSNDNTTNEAQRQQQAANDRHDFSTPLTTPTTTTTATLSQQQAVVENPALLVRRVYGAKPINSGDGQLPIAFARSCRYAPHLGPVQSSEGSGQYSRLGNPRVTFSRCSRQRQQRQLRRHVDQTVRQDSQRLVTAPRFRWRGPIMLLPILA
jgi:hypothetical protein